jgi:O-antigen ligase
MLMLLFALIVILSTTYTDAVKTSILTFFGDVRTIANEEDISGTGSGRGQLWSNAILCIKDKPIFGCGLENVGITKDYEPIFGIAPYNVHNFVLFFAMHTGIPGLLLYMASIVTCVVRLIKRRAQLTVESETAAIVVFAYLVSAFVGVAKFYTSPYYIIALAICTFACLYQQKPEKTAI